MRSVLIGALWIVAAIPALAQPRVIDAFDSLETWKVMPSDGVNAAASLVEGAEGKALRLEYNFEAGAGFVVLRREVPAEIAGGLPSNFRFGFKVRGEGPRNNLEFKLVDPSGDNVWWVNQRAYEWPREWLQERMPARRIAFAWGPIGASTPNPRPGKLGFIEVAIAASEGGRGHVDFDSLTFEALPPSARVTEIPELKAASRDTFDIDLKQSREFGGLILDWDGAAFPVDYDILSSADGSAFSIAAQVRSARGGKRFVPIRDGEGRALRIKVLREAEGPCRLRGVEVPGVEFGATPNAMFSEIAKRTPAGLLPRYFGGEQVYWTIVGIPQDRDEALLNTDGAMEIATSGFSIEPLIALRGGTPRLITWADVESTQSLMDHSLPIPTVEWRAGDLTVATTIFADGKVGRSTVVGRYEVRNRGPQPITGSLVLAIRPFQVLPPSQDLNITGGVSKIDTISRDGDIIEINGTPRLRALSAPTGFGATTFAAGEIVERWAEGEPPREQAVADPMRLASAGLSFDFALGPGESKVFAVEALLRPGETPWPEGASAPVADRLAAARDLWTGLLGRVKLSLPPSAARISDTFRATQAYILINQDGPAIQPGSRSYERSWMRDGSMTGAALIETGHAEDTRRFIEWIAPYQYPSGKVPCVVDRRGPDPVPEHDSHGELIYAIWNYYQFTGDRAFLERMWPHIDAAIGYIDSLRHQRMSEEFRSGPPEKRVLYGLVPESISHEGYSAKPMHSYWDSFFVIKGLHDAGAAATELGKADAAARIDTMLQEYRAAVYDSMRLAISMKGIDYIPGCAELGDFDATSTAIGVYPCGEGANIPHAELLHTFDRYFKFFEDRRDGRLEWKDYTPYELRIASTFIRLGQPERADALFDYFFRDQRPAAWNQWAEVVCRDPKTPRFLGDMPHTWVGSEFLHAARSMFVYERDQTLVLGAGVRPEWPAEAPGVQVSGFPTEFGALSYSLRQHGRQLTLKVERGIRPGKDRCAFVLPSTPPIQLITINGHPATPRQLDPTGTDPRKAVLWDGEEATVSIEFAPAQDSPR